MSILTIVLSTQARQTGMGWGIILGMYLDIFKHNATYAAKEITECVKIGIDWYIPHRKFLLKPHSSPWFTSCGTDIVHRNLNFH